MRFEPKDDHVPNFASHSPEPSQEFSIAVYRELRRLAAIYLRRERPDHTLQPTALVHETWIRMQSGSNLAFQSREQFFGFAARIMRQVLVDHARRHCAGKRPDIRQRCEMNDVYAFSLDKSEELLAVDQALDRLSSLDPRQAQIVELRFFAGLSEDEIADLLDISARTVKRDWRMAKAWLESELT
jgi:RNA polymerase sigma factor (TIGR02999 family)